MGKGRILFCASGEVGRETMIAAASAPFDKKEICAVLACPGDEGVIEVAKGNKIPLHLYDTKDLYSVIRQYAPEVVFLAWWPHLLKSEHLDLGQQFTLNMHPSLLPHCRGKDPNFWAIVEQAPFGVTIHHVSPGIDNGPIAFQRRLETLWTDTGGSLYKKATAEIVSLFSENYNRILRLDIPRLQQNDAASSFHTRAELTPKSTLDLNANYTGREILNLLRARTFPPHPAVTFSDGGETYSVRVCIERIEK
jgi:methionyl-tRNA formyltransferase